MLLSTSGCQTRGQVLTGLDVVAANGFAEFRGKRIGIITNPTGVDRHGRHIADLFHHARGVELVALFGPEHGIRGQAEAGQKVGTSVDSATGLPVYSLYDATRKPAQEMLKGLDALVFDIQGVGARFYTYISTMALAMEAAAEAGIEFYVLDRPNPIGDRVEGPLLRPERRSFVGIHPIALRHGMTAGELAQMFLGEGWLRTSASNSSERHRQRNYWHKLHVIPMQNWKRGELYNETGLRWIAPSPNMPSLATALLYPGICLLEATNISEGRGTTQPFQLIGAPWIDANRLASALENLVPGIALQPVTFTPVEMPGKAMNPKFEGIECFGLQLAVTDPEKFEAVKFGTALLLTLRHQYPEHFKIAESRLARLTGTGWVGDMILAGEDLARLWARLDEDAAQFHELRKPYLIYD